MKVSPRICSNCGSKESFKVVVNKHKLTNRFNFFVDNFICKCGHNQKTEYTKYALETKLSLLNARYKEINLTSGKLFVVGDISGRVSELYKQLENIGFNFNKDKLICTGDLINHGSENNLILDLLSKDWFYSTLGDNEKSILSYSFSMKNTKGYQDWFLSMSDINKTTMIESFSKLPYVLAVNHLDKLYLFAHASININSLNDLSYLLTNKIESNKILNDRDIFNSKAVEWVSGVEQIFLGHNLVDNFKTINNTTYVNLPCIKILNVGEWCD